MQARQFLKESAATVRTDGLEGINDVLYDCYRVALSRLSALDDGDFRVYDRDWDVLVVLDACRADLLASVAPEYEFLPPVQSVRSAAGNSEEWLRKTFAPEYADQMARTAYVTSNPFSESNLDAEDFAALDEVWRHAWDHDLGTLRPDPLTETAIYRWRSGRFDRMIVHYMQPHFPSIPRPEYRSGIDLDGVGTSWSSVWDQLRKGEIDREDVWDAYRENLEYVLESVEKLVRNIDADRVAITADHANSFGSWGLYGHPAAHIDAVRRVPWCEFEARNVWNTQIDTPTWVSTGDAEVDEDVSEKLRSLGYL